MPLNPDAVGAKGGPRRHTWNSTDCLLYALGVGAGAEDPVGSELQFTTENTAGVDQQVLPTFVVIPSFLAKGDPGAMSQVGTFDPRMLVHGEQHIRLFGPVPTGGTVTLSDEIVGIYDKGKGAVVATKVVGTLDDGEVLYESQSSVFIVGEGGFGGDRGPSNSVEIPDRDPDHAVSYTTREDQALLYRLSGDRNPLHSDKQFSDVGGFPRPILHGLCTYGFTGRGLLATYCDNDPTRFVAMGGRFSSPVLPGEALTVQMWDGDDGEAVFRTLGGDGRTVFDAGVFEYR